LDQIGRTAEYSEQRRRPNAQIAYRILQLLDIRWAAIAQWVGLALSLVLCYRGGQLPLILTGLLLFGGLALLRPDRALLCVPLTAPLFLVSAVLPFASPVRRLPPHELALLVTAGAALLQVAAKLYQSHDWRPMFADLRARLRAYAPELLFLAAGILGLFLGAPEPEARRDALRAFRWFVVEPLIFVTLVRVIAHRPAYPAARMAYGLRLAVALIVGGAAVASVGLFQYISYDLAAGPQLAVHGQFAGDEWRATSVYGNPNNLGLYLGRVWPLAAALALAAARSGPVRRRAALGYGLAALLCLGGILVSFSRGAWVGAGAALVVLALPIVGRWFRSRLLATWLVSGATTLLVVALICGLRGGPAGASTTVRLLFWRESLALVQQHPLGLGLDQFYYYHNPAYGRSLIDPTLANTQERDARQPHNLMLELWLNLGPAGLLACGWLMARSIRRARALMRRPASWPARALAHGALAALVAALAHGMVDAFYFWPDLAIAFWLLLLVIDASGDETLQQCAVQ
jgi:O-antigen ligase